MVLYGYQGADADAEQLALTDQLFDAAFAKLAVVARDSPCLLVGDFNVEPSKIPCLSKGISAGLWVDLDAAWSAAQGRHPAVTCKRSWDSSGGSRRDFLVGCPLATAALFSCSVSSCRWLQPVREPDRSHAKLECAGDTDLPHVVSENFSKPGCCWRQGASPAVSPCADSGWGRNFASLICRMHWCGCMVTPCVVAEILGGG